VKQIRARHIPTFFCPLDGIISPRSHEEHEEEMKFDSLSNVVIGAGILVHRTLGPGLLESAYDGCMAYELASRGVQIERQKALPIEYRGVRLDCSYRLDMVVEKRIILEFKAVQKMDRIHEAQMLTYLRLSGCPIGLIMNFNVSRFKDGLKRLIHGDPSCSS
jgi:GxxExxY protein